MIAEIEEKEKYIYSTKRFRQNGKDWTRFIDKFITVWFSIGNTKEINDDEKKHISNTWDEPNPKMHHSHRSLTAYSKRLL